MISSNQCTSAVLFQKLLTRALPLIPDLRFECVDVRDVARAHILAMTNPHAVGQRFLLAPHSLALQHLAAVLAAEFDPKGYNVPTGRLWFWVAWIASWFDKQLVYIVLSTATIWFGLIVGHA
jgi:dihydroflavonol-4-reductase